MLKLILLLGTVVILFGASNENVKSVQHSKTATKLDLSNYKEVNGTREHLYMDENISKQYRSGDYHYEPTEKGDGFEESETLTNPVFYGSFDKIYRFDPLYMEEDKDNDKTYEKILNTIKKYDSNDTEDIIVSLTGHTSSVEKPEEEVSLDSGYTNFFQSIAQDDDLDLNTSIDNANEYLEEVTKRLEDDNVSRRIMLIENRKGDVNLYTEAAGDGKDLNDRVDVVIYVKDFVDPDTDGDGVHDLKDYCPDTPLGSKVDVNGCPVVMTLNLVFSFDNAGIEDNKSFDDVMNLSDFMQKYPVYHATIIGHTDNAGPAAYNVKLSKRRAALVVDMLVNDGVDAKRLSSDGRGESEPVASNKTKEGRFKNRRTEVELFIPKKSARSKGLTLRKRGE